MMLTFRLASVGLILSLLAAVVTSSVSIVKCGDEIIKNTVLNSDFDCYCYQYDSESCMNGGDCGYDCAVVVKGPATLDLNGHTARGIRTAGKGVTIKNGITKGKIRVDDAEIKNVIAIGDGLVVVDNCTLLNVTSKDSSGKGIEIWGSKNRLTHVTVKNNSGDGIYVVGDNNRFLQVTSKDNGDAGIYVESGDNNRFLQVTSKGNSAAGIYFEFGNNNRLYNVTTTDNGSFGIRLSGNNNQVKDSYIAQSKTSCVASEGLGIVFKNNTVRRCSGYGVDIRYSKNSTIADSKFYATSSSSIVVHREDTGMRTTGNRITGNQINKSGAEGIVLEYAANSVVESNIIVDSAKDGIVLKSTSGRCTIKNNAVRNCGTAGIRIRGADDNNVTGNTVTSCRTGILAGVGAKRNRLINNRASKSIVFDLSDMSANCGSNLWKGNTGKGNIACTQNN